MWLFIIHTLFAWQLQKHIFYRGENYEKDVCKAKRACHNNPLQEKNVLPLTKKQEKKYKKLSQTCKQEFNDIFDEDENYLRVQNYFHYTVKYRGEAHSI